VDATLNDRTTCRVISDPINFVGFADSKMLWFVGCTKNRTWNRLLSSKNAEGC
jgi:hypothetical protein